ncbi:response regulator [Danxiaibacter flavus]|uniref:histidine kinase n=1 Tax=Danxiaibacter flavus TaxID=3049108 RepID=A0ABV3ZC63_9BACT|nr:response regulator [Chitinophagaceae bacterium DXS]
MSKPEIQYPFNILLVDDKEENLIVLEDILQGEGRGFLKASSGGEALKLVLKNNNIGLIMLDVQMPDIDGFEVARLLKSNPKTKNISIIFVTAISKEEHYILRGFEEGAVDYLQKPLDVNLVRAKVNVFEQLYFYQHKLQRSNEELEKVNKQLERFVHVVSHDLKSPLAGVSTIISMLEYNRYEMTDQELESNIIMLGSAVNYLSGMIDALLKYSKVSHSQQAKEILDVRVMLGQILNTLLPPKNISIVLPEKMPVLFTRKIKLQQVFQNILSNAIKYNDKEAGLLEVGYEDKGDHYVFYVKDNGPGIASDDQQKVFNLFETGNTLTKRESSTGIGLNVFKMLVEEQGGKVWVDSFYSEGSVFYFEWMK